MRTRFRNLWEVLRSTFWILPALMTVAAVVLSFGLVALDETVRDRVLEDVGLALGRRAERALPSPTRYDEGSQLRVLAYPFSFADATAAAFNQIRQYGRGSAAVTIRLLEVIGGVVAFTRSEEDRAALLQQASMIERASQKSIPEERDRPEVEARYQAVERALEQRSARYQPSGSSPPH